MPELICVPPWGVEAPGRGHFAAPAAWGSDEVDDELYDEDLDLDEDDEDFEEGDFFDDDNVDEDVEKPPGEDYEQDD